jgi:pimeloyl-ACP methyl ester carboxylesterase
MPEFSFTLTEYSPDKPFGRSSFVSVTDWIECYREGVHLAYRDFGGCGVPVLFLHGLAGHSGEWEETAARLRGQFRALALDQRGHGRSERRPDDLSRAAFVEDVRTLIEYLSLDSVVLVGQSMGGNTAFLTAAAYPERVRALVVVEASPDGPSPGLADQIAAWLNRWPIPFADVNTAYQFFASEHLPPGPWTDGLERRDDGLWPRFEKGVMVACIADLAARAYWNEWRGLRCPTLIVRGQHGNFPAEHMQDLARLLPSATAVTIQDASHDVHLEAAAAFADELKRFLAHASLRPG